MIAREWPVHRAQAKVVQIAVALLLALAAFQGCSHHALSPPAEEESAPQPAPPPCAHETCSERPRWLQCERPDWAGSGVVCMTYRIDYEVRCTCDTWGPRPDGGAP